VGGRVVEQTWNSNSTVVAMLLPVTAPRRKAANTHDNRPPPPLAFLFFLIWLWLSHLDHHPCLITRMPLMAPALTQTLLPQPLHVSATHTTPHTRGVTRCVPHDLPAGPVRPVHSGRGQ
jgi:hypothetical protein